MGELEKAVASQDVSFAQLLPLLTALKKSCIKRYVYWYIGFKLLFET